MTKSGFSAVEQSVLGQAPRDLCTI